MAPTLSAPIKQSRGVSSWGQISEAGPLPFCGHRSPEAVLLALSARVLQMHPSPALLCQEF